MRHSKWAGSFVATRMSALGHKLTFCEVQTLSALPPIAHRRGWLASPLDARGQHCGQSNQACARTHEHRAGSLCTKSLNNNNGGFSGFRKVGVPGFS